MARAGEPSRHGTGRPEPGRQLTDPRLQQLLAGLRAVRGGDFGIRLDKVGDPLVDEIATVFNEMVDQLALFTSEVTRVAREVGTEGRLGGQADVKGVSGTWKDLTDSVNAMAGNLTGQVRDIAEVATAVATGDLSRKITVDVRGEMLELKETINTMVDQLSSFADEVTRVAREVGTEGRLGGQAAVKGVSGTWKDLTDNVNSMASNLTSQVRNIAQVTTAVAQGDLSKKIDVDARGEILELKTTHQHHGRPALLLRRRGDPGRPRGGPARAAGRPGRGGGGRGYLEAADRGRQRARGEPDPPGPGDRRGGERGRHG
jgi:HAMP domain-containing protein